MLAEFAIIGGTGVYRSDLLTDHRVEEIATEYGNVQVTLGDYAGKRVAFLSRHGKGHAVPPHQVNYRANIQALKSLGVTQVLATAAVGSMRPDIQPGELILINDFIDMTHSRPQTFYEGEQGVIHVDMSDPYCARVRGNLQLAADKLSISLRPTGTYVCTEGPRFETAAEIRAYSQWGGDIVGMTSVPEVILAKEAALCYAAIGIVTNFCTGISDQALTHQEVTETMQANIERVQRLFAQVISDSNGERSCMCSHAIDELGSL